MTDTDQYDEIRRRIEKRYKERQYLMIHIASFVAANIAFWALWGNAGWLMWFLTFPWGIGVVGHMIYYYYKFGGGAERREAAIQRDVEREKERLGLYDKPKNDTRTRLSDDGEVEEVVDEEEEISRAAKRRRSY